jgi:cytidylate kinase
MKIHMQIAIDGPAGSGKSTIGERVARSLGYLYVDTGAFYRTLTAVALRHRVDPDDGDALRRLLEDTRMRIVPATVADGRQYTVLAGGEDITHDLRTPEVEATVSRVSRHPAVRAMLRVRQREMVDDHPVVMVGRDIGTVVLPDADLKVYLTTSLEERAQRRHGDLVAALGPQSPSLDEVRQEIHMRDEKDAAQLHPAADAVVIDNSYLSQDETVERVLELVRERRRSLAALSDGLPSEASAPPAGQRQTASADEHR